MEMEHLDEDTALPFATSSLANRLAKTLAVAAHGLPNLFDESTDFFHGFSASLADNRALDADAVKEALDVGAAYHIDLRPGQDFFDAARDYGDPETEAAFALLLRLMQATLTDLTVAFARKQGVVRVRMWLFGRLANGELVGLRSEATET
jgi:hypothetical protein